MCADYFYDSLIFFDIPKDCYGFSKYSLIFVTKFSLRFFVVFLIRIKKQTKKKQMPRVAQTGKQLLDFSFEFEKFVRNRKATLKLL